VNILFVASRFPYPPDRGDRLTVLNLLRAMSARHRVTLLSFVDGREPAEARARVAEHCERIETVHLPRARSWAQAWLGLASSEPSQVSYYASAEMRASVRRLLAAERFDAIFTHTIRMANHVLDVPHPAKVLWVADSIGLVLQRSMAFQPLWKRPGIAWERHRVDAFEARVSRRFREMWAISPSDVADLERIGCERVALITHGVDERLFELVREPAPEPRVVFLGNLSVPHNIDAAVFAAREVLPLLRAARPDVRLVLAGADPAPAVRRLATLEGVEVTGALPDLRVVWASAHVLLAPLRFATGIQNKVLEAMAAGVPVVTVPPVADAIHARAGETVLTASDAAGLAAAVLEVVRDPAAAAARARRAREHVREHFSWDTAVKRLERLATEVPGDVRAAARG
jgi:polysaccharide biosynthesis protein PslH